MRTVLSMVGTKTRVTRQLVVEKRLMNLLRQRTSEAMRVFRDSVAPVERTSMSCSCEDSRY